MGPLRRKPAGAVDLAKERDWLDAKVHDAVANMSATEPGNMDKVLCYRCNYGFDP